MALDLSRQKRFKNTFAPHCPDESLTAIQVIGLLKFSALQSDDLPKGHAFTSSSGLRSILGLPHA